MTASCICHDLPTTTTRVTLATVHLDVESVDNAPKATDYVAAIYNRALRVDSVGTSSFPSLLLVSAQGVRCC